MGSIAVHEFVSLDGVFETPTWTFEYGFDPRMTDAISKMMSSSTAILLGRITFEAFAPAWSIRSAADDPGAPFFNDSPKYVVGARKPAVEWANSKYIGPYDPDVIRKLKNDVDGGIYISGSGMLVRALLTERLVDELHLFIYPIVLGGGERFWADQADKNKLALLNNEVYDNGVVHLVYGPA